jgi:hypothetical protein
MGRDSFPSVAFVLQLQEDGIQAADCKDQSVLIDIFIGPQVGIIHLDLLRFLVFGHNKFTEEDPLFCQATL